MGVSLGDLFGEAAKSVLTFGMDGEEGIYCHRLVDAHLIAAAPELYEALDRGTIYGYMAPIQLAHACKHYEVGKYVVRTGSGTVPPTR